jgi:hypothetical protein
MSINFGPAYVARTDPNKLITWYNSSDAKTRISDNDIPKPGQVYTIIYLQNNGPPNPNDVKLDRLYGNFLLKSLNTKPGASANVLLFDSVTVQKVRKLDNGTYQLDEPVFEISGLQYPFFFSKFNTQEMENWIHWYVTEILKLSENDLDSYYNNLIAFDETMPLGDVSNDNDGQEASANDAAEVAAREEAERQRIAREEAERLRQEAERQRLAREEAERLRREAERPVAPSPSAFALIFPADKAEQLDLSKKYNVRWSKYAIFGEYERNNATLSYEPAKRTLTVVTDGNSETFDIPITSETYATFSVEPSDGTGSGSGGSPSVGSIQKLFDKLHEVQQHLNALSQDIYKIKPADISQIQTQLNEILSSMGKFASKDEIQQFKEELTQLTNIVQGFSITLQNAQVSVPDNVLAEITNIKSTLQKLVDELKKTRPVPEPQPVLGGAPSASLPSPTPPPRPPSAPSPHKPPVRDECCDDILKIKEAELVKLEAEFARLQAVREAHQNKYFEMLKKEFE